MAKPDMKVESVGIGGGEVSDRRVPIGGGRFWQSRSPWQLDLWWRLRLNDHRV
jgi:hypothetical protein